MFEYVVFNDPLSPSEETDDAEGGDSWSRMHVANLSSPDLEDNWFVISSSMTEGGGDLAFSSSRISFS